MHYQLEQVEADSYRRMTWSTYRLGRYTSLTDATQALRYRAWAIHHSGLESLTYVRLRPVREGEQ